MGVLWSPPSLTLILQSSELEGEEGLLLSGERGEGTGRWAASGRALGPE